MLIKRTIWVAECLKCERMSFARQVHYTDRACRLIIDAKRLHKEPKGKTNPVVDKLLDAAVLYEQLAEKEAKEL